MTFKIAVLIFQSYTGTTPEDLRELVIKPHHGHSLCTLTSEEVPFPRCNNTQTQIGTFHSIGPKVWNNLPGEFRRPSSISI